MSLHPEEMVYLSAEVDEKQERELEKVNAFYLQKEAEVNTSFRQHPQIFEMMG